MVWTVNITSVNNDRYSLSIDYDILKDNVIVSSETTNLQGDVIDLGKLKGHVLYQVNKLKGVDGKANQIEFLEGKTFQLNNDGTDLIVQG